MEKKGGRRTRKGIDKKRGDIYDEVPKNQQIKETFILGKKTIFLNSYHLNKWSPAPPPPPSPSLPPQ